MTDPVDPTPHPASSTREPAGWDSDRPFDAPGLQVDPGSDRSSGGSGEPTADGDDRASTAEDQTDWLRRADLGPTSS